MSGDDGCGRRNKPRRIALPCDGCGVVIIGTNLRAFDEARAEHDEQAHGIKRPEPEPTDEQPR